MQSRITIESFSRERLFSLNYHVRGEYLLHASTMPYLAAHRPSRLFPGLPMIPHGHAHPSGSLRIPSRGRTHGPRNSH